MCSYYDCVRLRSRCRCRLCSRSRRFRHNFHITQRSYALPLQEYPDDAVPRHRVHISRTRIANQRIYLHQSLQTSRTALALWRKICRHTSRNQRLVRIVARIREPIHSGPKVRKRNVVDDSDAAEGQRGEVEVEEHLPVRVRKSQEVVVYEVRSVVHLERYPADNYDYRFVRKESSL